MNVPHNPGPPGSDGVMEGTTLSGVRAANEPVTEYTHPVDYTKQEDPVLQNIHDALLLIENDITTFEQRLAALKPKRFESQVMADMYLSAQDHLIAALTVQIHLLKAKLNHARQ